jgi:tRNA(Ile)-lysidine synthetase-like protein
MEEAYHFLDDEIKSSDQTVVVAVSGGPDSMAALHLLLCLREKRGINIICAHINHNVRKESLNEQIALKNYCIKNQVTFESMTINEYNKSNFESEAREKRYEFFEEIIHKYKAKYLVTAHHGDDLMETILMRISRGSTFKGYAGFSRITEKSGYKILRPLIGTTKDEIITYNEDNEIDYSIDATNMTDEHTRNRYRKNILPFLKKEDINVHNHFLKFSQKILEYSEYVDREMSKIIDDVYINRALNIELFLMLDKIIQDRILNYIMEEIYGEELSLITDVHTEAIMRIILSARPNTYVHLPNNIRVMKSYKMLYFLEEDRRYNDYCMEFSRNIVLPNGKKIIEAEDNDEKSNYICRLDSKELEFPLYIRNRREGDKIRVKGMNGHKKIKDIFIDEKININDRNLWPILIDNSGEILWLPGLKKTKYDKSKKETYDIIIKYI